MKLLFTILLLHTYLYANTQVITQPLFMQIKPPAIESYSGELVDKSKSIYYIDSSSKDSIDISFLISVPKEMLSEKWAISLTPTITSAYKDGILKDVVIKGWRFADVQQRDYNKYNEFINSIIDSSMYSKMYIDQKRLEKEIEQRHDQYWQYHYDEWERQVAYEIWKSQQSGSIQVYSTKERQDYREQLYKQYLLRIENQSKRYIKANMDTTGLYSKYIGEFEEHSRKMPRFFVNNKAVNNKKIPKNFQDIHNSGRTLDDITQSMLELLVERDSALMSLPVLDYGKIIENEKRTILQKGIFNDIIQLPKNENALLDTTIYNIHTDYTYLYTYRYPVLKHFDDTVKITLQSRVLATDRSGYSSSSENTLNYIVSERKPTKHRVVNTLTTAPIIRGDELEDY